MKSPGRALVAALRREPQRLSRGGWGRYAGQHARRL